MGYGPGLMTLNKQFMIFLDAIGDLYHYFRDLYQLLIYINHCNIVRIN